MFGFHEKVRRFFDSAKDLALEIVTRIEGPEMPLDTELVPLMCSLGDADSVTLEHTIELRPKRSSYIMGAKAFMEHGIVEILSIKPTMSSLGSPDDERTPPNSPIDAAYYVTDESYVPFDFGCADAEHPIMLKVRFTAKARELGAAKGVDKVMLNMMAIATSKTPPWVQDGQSREGWSAFSEGIEHQREELRKHGDQH